MSLVSKMPFALRHMLPITPQARELYAQRREIISTAEKIRERFSPEAVDELAIPSYTHRNPLLRFLVWERLAVALEWLDAVCLSPSTVMDFGCGIGPLFLAFARRGHRVIACDIRPDAAQAGTAASGLADTTIVDARDGLGSVPDDSVDAVLALEVLEHVNNVAPLAAEFRRILRPRGALLCSLPTENLWYRMGRRLAGFSGSYHRHDTRAVVDLLSSVLNTRKIAQLYPILPFYRFFEARP